MNKETIKLVQIIAKEWKTPSGEDRFNIYGLGVDGAVYKKISDKKRESRGWIRLSMVMEYDDGDENYGE